MTGTDDGASVVYDRDATDPAAQSNGQIYYAAPEANAPGLEVLNGTYTAGGNTYDGCLIATSTATCTSDFQSGKRFKEQLTDTGSVDLVFNTTPGDESTLYQAFHRVVNLTGAQIEGFELSLGVGVGSDFVQSGANDGLSFSSTVELGPDKVSAFSQYPFGLFGDDAQPNPNPVFTLDGFFQGDGRSGFNLTIGEDMIASNGYYGEYDDLFDNWLSKDQTPEGLLWDYSGGVSDPLVMAWDNGTEWEVRRGIDDALDGVLGVLSVNDVFALDEADWETFSYADLAGVQGFLSGVDLFADPIEDLANLNLNYAIALDERWTSSSFTLRLSSTAVPAAVPLPASAPLMLAGFALMAAMRRRRRAA